MKKLIVEGIDLTEFLGVPYAAGRHPNNMAVENFLRDKTPGANCELFALAVWRKAGFYVEQKRSIELWRDSDFTLEVEEPPYKPFDNFMFLPKGADPHKLEKEIQNLPNLSPAHLNELKKFHQAVYIFPDENPNQELFLHLPKPGSSCIWRFEDFAKAEKEYRLFQVKRPFIKLSAR